MQSPPREVWIPPSASIPPLNGTWAVPRWRATVLEGQALRPLVSKTRPCVH